MCVKFFLEDLNPDSCPQLLTDTYTYRVTITLRVFGGNILIYN